ncbi:MAG: type II secretion system F family protein [Patescibacteria group bacterium]|nr:type II secretion system F family protein [Patescibacteria group bacterium]
MLFNYKAKTQNGDVVEGIIGATSPEVAATTLSDRELIVIDIIEYQEESFLEKIDLWFNKVKTKDLVIFSRQLSVMVSSGLPLVEALKTLIQQVKNPKLNKIVTTLASDVESGTRFSSSLARFPNVFNHFFVSMIKTGETTGKLDQMLLYLADQEEKNYTLRRKIQGMMIYPAFIICALVVVAFVMMTFVLPKLLSIITEADMELPITTRMLVATSNFFVGYWWLMIIIVLGLIVTFIFYRKTPEGKMRIDNLKLRIPIVGDLYQKIYLVRFSQGLSVLLAGGVPLTYALKVVGQIVDNQVYQELINQTRERVESGHSVTELFFDNKLVPQMIPQMMSVGEETGKLGQVLEKASQFYINEVDDAISNIVSLIEPIIIVALGIAVAIMVSSIIMPMYSMSMAF